MCLNQLYILFMDKKLNWRVKVKVKSLSRVQLFATPWTIVCQASPSIGFSRQEYQNGLQNTTLL